LSPSCGVAIFAAAMAHCVSLKRRRSGEVFATPILFLLAPLGLSVPDIPIGFRRRLTQAHSRPSSTYFFDFSDDF
jgi:hypothetical protein